ncbi:MAG: TRAP transporter large permease [Alphaproteobacteria bacterium]
MIPIMLAVLLLLLAIGMPIAASLGLLGYTLQAQFAFLPMLGVLGEITWNTSTEFVLIAAPMFIMMGELMHRSGVSQRLFVALAPWFNWLPGRLMHTNIAAAAIFAATSGSSVATAATIGTVAIPNMKPGGYSPSLFLGTIAAGGTLGILIPPSINMIIYAVISDTSVTRLYAAGLIPGLILAALFSITVLLLCIWRPALGGHGMERALLRSKRLAGLIHLLPPLGLFMVVVGSIYAGFATPTEAAALGVIAALALAAANKGLSWSVLMGAFEGTVRTTCMVMLIVIAAFFLNFVMVGIGVIKSVTDFITGLGWPPLAVLVAIIVFYLILGCVMETLSMMIATTAIIVPVNTALGYDAVWWGIVFMILMEAALITPPIGLNLFVVQSVYPAGRFGDICLGSVPFVVAMVIMIGLLIAFPDIALWLPDVLNSKK